MYLGKFCPRNNFTKYGFKKTDKLFDPIIGFDDIKEIFQLSINADKPVHILLVGPPASAKSIFMNCLTKLKQNFVVVQQNQGYLITYLNIDQDNS